MALYGGQTGGIGQRRRSALIAAMLPLAGTAPAALAGDQARQQMLFLHGGTTGALTNAPPGPNALLGGGHPGPIGGPGLGQKPDPFTGSPMMGGPGYTSHNNAPTIRYPGPRPLGLPRYKTRNNNPTMPDPGPRVFGRGLARRRPPMMGGGPGF